jgi:hypothetical protein
MFQVSSREGVQEFVPKLATLVKKYAIPFFRGDEDAYRTALESRAKQYADEVREGNLRVVRSKVDAAWQAKDYAQVVELYGPIREDLTKVEAYFSQPRPARSSCRRMLSATACIPFLKGSNT